MNENDPEEEDIFFGKYTFKPPVKEEPPKPPPGVLLGNAPEPIYLTPEFRPRHVYMIGLSEMGKTTLMQNMMLADMEQGHGLAFIDPHGDAADRMLGLIPKSRIDDVIFFDPDDEQSAQFNPLLLPFNKFKIALDLVAVFKLFYGRDWSNPQENIMRNTILALLLDTKPHCVADIRKMLIDEEYRTTINYHRDVKDFWEKQFDNQPKGSIVSLTTKLDNVLIGKMHDVFLATQNDLDFWKIMQEGKILICRLAKGALSGAAAQLMGGFLVTGIQQAALAREKIKEDDRKPFQLYVDEFQNFQIDSFDEIMSESRKYKLYLLLAHQRLSQISERLQDAASMAGTRIAFQVHQDDEKKVRSIMNVSRMLWRKPDRDWEPVMTFKEYAIEHLTRELELYTNTDIIKGIKTALRQAQTAFSPTQMRELARAHVNYRVGLNDHRRHFYFPQTIEFKQEEFPEKYELQNLPKYVAFVRLGSNERVYRIQTLKAPEPDEFIKNYILLKRPRRVTEQPDSDRVTPATHHNLYTSEFPPAPPLDASKPVKIEGNDGVSANESGIWRPIPREDPKPSPKRKRGRPKKQPE